MFARIDGMVVRDAFHRTAKVLLLLVATLLVAQPALARNGVNGLRLGSHPDGITRFVMDLAEGMDFSVATFSGPNRVVVSTPDLGWNAPAHRPAGAVRSVRYEGAADSGRIVVELKDPALVKSAFVIPPRDGLGWRFVMDLQQTSPAAFAAASVPFRPAPSPPGATVSEPPPPPDGAAQARAIVVYSPEVKAVPAATAVPVSAQAPTQVSAQVSAQAPVQAPAVRVDPPPARPAAEPIPVPEPRPQPAKAGKGAAPMLSAPVPPPLERPAAEPGLVKIAAPAPAPAPMSEPPPRALPMDGKPVVVIDPGHGGVDPGATGVSGIYEKYITLAIARELKGQLEKGGRYKVHLTRDRDVFIRLRDRIAIARQYGADLFISLHADSVANPSLKGLSVYTLSQTASDSEAQTLADKENKADLIAGIDLSHESADVANILIDLAQRETMNRSALFAGGVVDEVGRDTPLLGNTHRFAGFAVLKAPDVPSVLVELGYLSNEVEERNLRQPEYRTRLTKALARSVDRFFLQGQKARRP